jgi:hypothetical protein
MEEASTSDFTSYILLCVSGLLVFIDGLELVHIINNWQYGSLFVIPLFEKCIKYELISKTIFAIFSLISALSAFFLSTFLLFAQNFFLEKILKTFLYVNYLVFGPLMLTLSLLGIDYWDEIVYVCEKNNLTNKEFSMSNTTSIVGCFLISVFITLLVEFLESFNFLLDSILKRNSGSVIIGKFYWKVVFLRTSRDRLRAYDGLSNNEDQNHNSEILNNMNYINNDNNIIEIGSLVQINKNNNDGNSDQIYNNCEINTSNNQHNIINVNEDHIDITNCVKI